MPCLEDYRKIRILGQGSFGKCTLVEDVKTKTLYVLKEVSVAQLSKKEIDDAVREAKILASLQHPNICAYVTSFSQRGLLCLVMEYANKGDLHNLLKCQQGRLLPEDLILDIFIQICLALNYVHSKKILHRDIKAQNIFLCKGNIVKLGDFGVSRVLNGTFEMARTAIGTPYYLSPEICSDAPYSFKSDVWSLGCLLYELLTLRHPFDAANMKGLVTKIMRGTYPRIPSQYSAGVRELIDEMLSKDPKRRPTVDQILHKPLLRPRLEKYVAGEAVPPPLAVPAGPSAAPMRGPGPLGNPLLAEYARPPQRQYPVAQKPSAPPHARPSSAWNAPPPRAQPAAPAKPVPQPLGPPARQPVSRPAYHAPGPAPSKAVPQSKPAPAPPARGPAQTSLQARLDELELEYRQGNQVRPRAEPPAQPRVAARPAQPAAPQPDRVRKPDPRIPARQASQQPASSPGRDSALDARAARVELHKEQERRVRDMREQELRAKEQREAREKQLHEQAAIRAREDIERSRAQRESDRQAMREKMRQQRAQVQSSADIILGAPGQKQPIVLDNSEGDGHVTPPPSKNDDADRQLTIDQLMSPPADEPQVMGLEEALEDHEPDANTALAIRTMIADIRSVLQREEAAADTRPVTPHHGVESLSSTTRIRAGQGVFRDESGEVDLTDRTPDSNSVLMRIEALRQYLEERLGLERFSTAYNILDKLSSENQDEETEAALDTELDRVLGEERGSMALISQLLVAEDNFNTS